MSTPGGFDLTPTAAQNRPSRGNNTCLIGGIVGCGVLLICMIVGGVATFIFASRSPGFKSLMDQAGSSQSCGNVMVQLRDSLKKYRSDHNGAWPAQLKDLVPKYASDQAALSCTGASGTPLTATYHVPPAGSSNEFVVVSVALGGGPFIGGLNQRSYVVITKSGRVLTEQVQYSDYEQRMSGGFGSSTGN